MKLAIATGTRAEYGIFRPLLRAFAGRGWPFELYVTGTHLSPEHGLTIGEIEADGFPIAERIDIAIGDDSTRGVTHSMALALSGFGEALERRRPDLLFILGDRFEALAIAAAAQVARVPVAHLHGGETTEGAIDEAFRHAVTKMSHLHFTSTEAYRNRVIQLGEAPERVFAVGALGLDNLQDLEPIGRVELEAELGIKLRERNLLVTQHPLTLDPEQSVHDLAALLEALDRFPDVGVVMTAPNADPGGRQAAAALEDYAAKRPDRVKLVASLGSRRYFGLLRLVHAAVGNSSSGLIEVPSFGIPTVNVGCRQQGRIAGPSVIHVEGDAGAIAAAIERALSPAARQAAADAPNPYGSGNTAAAICRIIKGLEPPIRVEKSFHDMPFPPAA
jgi:UDP-hydrolysing UDP-N-acetyl-D-glucosamine 2-epimerase